MDSVCYICVYVRVYNTYMLLCAIIEFKRKRLWILEVGKTGTNCFVGVKNGATIVLKNEIIKKYFKSNFKNI